MQAFSTIVSRGAQPHGDDGAVFRAEVTADWLQGKAAFGGLQGALVALAMREAAGDALPLRALQMTFVASVDAGEARAEAAVLRRGRAVTHVQCTLHSAGRPAAIAVGLYGAPRDSRARADMAMPELRAPAELREAPFLPALMPAFLQHFRQRWAGGSVPFSGGPLKPASMWARLREATRDDASERGAPHDDAQVTLLDGAADADSLPVALDTAAGREACLVALCDLPPSPVMSTLERRAPGASLTWLLEPLVDARAFDPRTWLLLHTETRHAVDGYTSQTARIWDAARRSVAVSHQTTAIFD